MIVSEAQEQCGNCVERLLFGVGFYVEARDAYLTESLRNSLCLCGILEYINTNSLVTKEKSCLC